MDLFQPGPVRWVQSTLGPGWEGLAELLTALGSTWGIILILGLALWVWGRPAAYAVLLTAAVETAIKKGLAAFVYVPRPEGQGIISYEEVEGITSFPSGHTSTAVAVWAVLAFLGYVPFWLALGMGALVGITRLYLGVHWLADIVGSLLLGIAVAWVVARVHPRVQRRVENVPAAVWWSAGLVITGMAVLWASFWMADRSIQWTAAGFLAGLGLALPLERALGPAGPETSGAGRHRRERARALRVAAGFAGVAVCFGVARYVTSGVLVAQGALALTATLWALFAAPALVGGTPDTRNASPAQRSRPREA